MLGISNVQDDEGYLGVNATLGGIIIAFPSAIICFNAVVALGIAAPIAAPSQRSAEGHDYRSFLYHGDFESIGNPRSN